MTEEAGSEQLLLTASVDATDRLTGPAKRSLLALERATLLADRPVHAVVRRHQFNPLHYTGPISVLLFVVVAATGVYLTMFYRFGFTASYESVADIEASLAGRFIRAGHRYASIALVVTSVLHGWRTFVMDRFRGPRRMAWLTGVAMVALVWVIGVTGYWLIWDERVSVLNEALTRVLAAVPSGLDFLLDFVLTDAAGTGWPFLLLLFLIHLGLSVGVGALVWVHLRRLARAQWLPGRFWTAVVLGSVVVLSLAWPVGMLEPLERSVLPGPIPIDPFFLFLAPGSVSWPPGWLWGGALLATAAIMFLPWIIRRRPAPVVEVDAERCTGCNLCVVDCPYDALSLVDTENGAHPHLAVLTETSCVGCGICVGSCPVLALSFAGRPPERLWAEATSAGPGETVVLICERHRTHSPSTGTPSVAVPCIGMIHPDLVGAVLAGGRAVHIVGCPPGDCANREGVTTLNARLRRRRRPRLKPQHADADLTFDWTAPDRLAVARRQPGQHSDGALELQLDGPTLRAATPLVVLVAATAVFSVWVTGFRFDPDRAGAAITLSLDHRAGVPLAGFPPFEPNPTGEAPRLTVTLDGVPLFDDTVALANADEPATALLYETFDIEPGTHRLEVTLFDGPNAPGQRLFADTVAVGEGEVIVLEFRDAPVVDPAAAGRDLFNTTVLGTSSGCRICHSLDPGRELVGPSLAGVATRAGSTVAGLDAEQYLRQSLVDPDAYVVPGYPAGQMLEVPLSDQEVDYLVAFLSTLEEER